MNIQITKLDKDLDLLDTQVKAGLNTDDVKLLKDLDGRVNDLEHLKKSLVDVEFILKNQKASNENIKKDINNIFDTLNKKAEQGKFWELKETVRMT